jgi:hypothetical protein
VVSGNTARAKMQGHVYQGWFPDASLARNEGPKMSSDVAPDLCPICGDRAPYEKNYGIEFGLCGVCAEAIANSYHYAHSGRWLTYKNEPTVPSRPPMRADTRWSVLRFANFKCSQCGEAERPLHVDHIVPLSRGGSGEMENLQCLCDRCNLRKGAR